MPAPRAGGPSRLPLHGVRVLDLTRLLPGACATLLLADLGADVIKIEDPRGGDPARHMPPLEQGTSVYFRVLNRNKRSVTLDLRSADAVPVLDALARQSDVVVDSFRPSTARRLAVDAASLGARHPRLVCASITGFGRSGPYVDRAAHDINYQALVGLLTVGARQPQVPRLLIADIGAALHTSSGILAALYQRERTGVGAAVDISIHEAALAWMQFPSAPDLVVRDDGAAERSREGMAMSLPPVLTGGAACYSVYETADGQYLALGALEPKFWAGFCERIGRPDLAPLQHVEGDERRRVLETVRAIMRTREREDWLTVFEDADVCLTPICTLADAMVDPHLLARRAIVPAGGSRYITAPIAVAPTASAGEPDAVGDIEIRPAPALGADTDGILASAGIGAEERASLRQRGVI